MPVEARADEKDVNKDVAISSASVSGPVRAGPGLAWPGLALWEQESLSLRAGRMSRLKGFCSVHRRGRCALMSDFSCFDSSCDFGMICNRGEGELGCDVSRVASELN